MNITKVVLVDDHHLIRMGIKALLKPESGIIVVGEVDKAKHAIKYIEEKQPDVVLMDISLIDGDGILLTKAISDLHKNIKVIILSMHVKEDFIQRSIMAGASGYILKDSTEQELISAIKKVTKGEKYFASEISRFMVTRYVNKIRDTSVKKRKI